MHLISKLDELGLSVAISGDRLELESKCLLVVRLVAGERLHSLVKRTENSVGGGSGTEDPVWGKGGGSRGGGATGRVLALGRVVGQVVDGAANPNSLGNLGMLAAEGPEMGHVKVVRDKHLGQLGFVTVNTLAHLLAPGSSSLLVGFCDCPVAAL